MSTFLDDAAAKAFDAPWQVRAMAIVAALQRRGLVTPGEWAEALSLQIREDEAPAQGSATRAYFAQVMRALEHCLEAKGLADHAEIDRFRDAWAQAQRRTPHGQPVQLRPEDFPA